MLGGGRARFGMLCVMRVSVGQQGGVQLGGVADPQTKRRLT